MNLYKWESQATENKRKLQDLWENRLTFVSHKAFKDSVKSKLNISDPTYYRYRKELRLKHY